MDMNDLLPEDVVRGYCELRRNGKQHLSFLTNLLAQIEREKMVPDFISSELVEKIAEDAIAPIHNILGGPAKEEMETHIANTAADCALACVQYPMNWKAEASLSQDDYGNSQAIAINHDLPKKEERARAILLTVLCDLSKNPDSERTLLLGLKTMEAIPSCLKPFTESFTDAIFKGKNPDFHATALCLWAKEDNDGLKSLVNRCMKEITVPSSGQKILCYLSDKYKTRCNNRTRAGIRLLHDFTLHGSLGYCEDVFQAVFKAAKDMDDDWTRLEAIKTLGAMLAHSTEDFPKNHLRAVIALSKKSTLLTCDVRALTTALESIPEGSPLRDVAFPKGALLKAVDAPANV